jgi:Zeta toxin
MPDRPPLAVLIGGAPGSGKTTLAEALGPTLDIPLLHADDLVHGRWRTLGRGKELGAWHVEPFYQSMTLLAEAGISFISEQTWRPGISEADVIKRLAPLCTLVQVHCRSHNSFERWERRMRQDPLCGPRRLAKLTPTIRQLGNDLIKPLDFRCPTIVVNTDLGYEPSLESIAAQIDVLYGRPLFHELDPQ